MARPALDRPARPLQPDVERVRYVAFRLASPVRVARPAFIAALRRATAAAGPGVEAAAKPWLTRFDGIRGILRCAHTGRDAAVALLTAVRDVNGVAVTVETVGTSGTIAGCVRKFLPDLEDLGEEPKRR